MPAGRPSIYTSLLADHICSEIAHGKSLVSICKEKEIGYTTVSDWLLDPNKKEFAENYARARESQADYLAEEIIDISDDSSLPSDDRRIKIDTRKWYAGKVRPKKYSDRQVIAGDPDAPVQHNHAGKIDMGADLIASAIERVIGKNEKDTDDIQT